MDASKSLGEQNHHQNLAQLSRLPAVDWQVVLLLLPLAGLILFLNFQAPVDVDYWWHHRTGQYILTTHSIPDQDIFSYSAQGQSWITHEWLSEVVMYVLQTLFGYGLEVLFFGLVGVLTWGLVYQTCRLRQASPAFSVVLTLLGFVISVYAFGVRPQTFSTLLCALTLYILTRYRLGKPRTLWLLPGLFALWVNLHGGYIIGLALLAIALLGGLVERRMGKQNQPLRPLFVAVTLSAAATLLNPHGLSAWLYPFSYAGSSNASMRFIAEWQSPDFHDPTNLLFATSLIFLVAVGSSQRLESIPEALLAAALTFLALRSNRHVPLYAVAVAPLLSARLSALTPSIRIGLRPWLSFAGLLVPWIILVAQLGSAAGKVWQDVGPIFQIQPDPIADNRDMPVGAAAYIQANILTGKLFNEYAWGGYLIYQFYPQRIVDIDGRADMYGDAFMQQYMDITSLKPNWRDLLHRQGIQDILIRTDSPLAVVLSTDTAWKAVYRGPVESLFVRN